MSKGEDGVGGATMDTMGRLSETDRGDTEMGQQGRLPVGHPQINASPQMTLTEFL